MYYNIVSYLATYFLFGQNVVNLNFIYVIITECNLKTCLVIIVMFAVPENRGIVTVVCHHLYIL